MRELERDHSEATSSPAPALTGRLAIVGAGRAGGSIAAAARGAGLHVAVTRRVPEPGASIVLFCVPDGAIGDACEAALPHLAPGTFAGHISGATTLEALEAARMAGCETFSLHPLQTIPTPTTDLAGAPCAVASNTPEGAAVARALAERLGMLPFAVPEEGRAAYHAAASMASNFLVALEESAAGAMESAGVENARAVLAPLVLRSAANWADSGAAALTGPIARGDDETVALHVEALTERAPELLPLYDALADRTRAVGSAR